MKAVVLEGFGDVDNLELENLNDPVANAGEILVRVRATSVNPVDLKIRSGASKGRFNITPPAILGRDIAGEIVQIGEGVNGLSKGQRVMALGNQSYAELAIVKADDAVQIPDGLSFEQAAALPLVTITGAQLIEKAVKIKSGETILILGALGSVGRSAVHVALQHGARVIAGVRKNQVEEAKSLGAERVVAIDDEKELAQLRDLDAVADTVGGAVGTSALKTLKKGGVFGSVLGPPKDAEKYDVRVEAFMAQPDASRLKNLAQDAARGDLTIPIAKILPLEQVRQAHTEAEQGKVNGKIVLLVA